MRKALPFPIYKYKQLRLFGSFSRRPMRFNRHGSFPGDLHRNWRPRSGQVYGAALKGFIYPFISAWPELFFSFNRPDNLPINSFWYSGRQLVVLALSCLYLTLTCNKITSGLVVFPSDNEPGDALEGIYYFQEMLKGSSRNAKPSLYQNWHLWYLVFHWQEWKLSI